MNESTTFFVRSVERQINEKLGGEASVRDIVELMIEMGWKPPAEPLKSHPSFGHQFTK